MLDKLSGTYAPRPSNGPHKLREALPLVVSIDSTRQIQQHPAYPFAMRDKINRQLDIRWKETNQHSTERMKETQTRWIPSRHLAISEGSTGFRRWNRRAKRR